MSLVCLSAVDSLKVPSGSNAKSASSLSGGGAVLVCVNREDCCCGRRLGTASTAPQPSCGVLSPLLALNALLCGQLFSLRRQLTPQGCLSTLRWGLRGSGRSLDLPKVFQCGFVELLTGEGGSSLDPDHASTPRAAPEGESSSEPAVSHQPSSHCLASAAHHR